MHAYDRKNAYGFINAFYSKLNLNYNISLFDAPKIGNVTIGMTTIDDIISGFIGSYVDYHACSFSTGSLVLGAYLHKEANENDAKTLEVSRSGVNFKTISVKRNIRSFIFEFYDRYGI
jgi:homospermidine synthase